MYKLLTFIFGDPLSAMIWSWLAQADRRNRNTCAEIETMKVLWRAEQSQSEEWDPET